MLHDEVTDFDHDNMIRKETEGKSMNSITLSEDDGDPTTTTAVAVEDKILNTEEIVLKNNEVSSQSDGLLVLSVATLGQMAKDNPGTLPGKSISNT